MRSVFRKLGSLLSAAVMLLGSLYPAAAAAPQTYANMDVGSPWYEAVRYVTDAGISIGMEDGSFAADSLLTVGQWSLMLLRAYDSENAVFDTDAEYPTDYVAACFKNQYLYETALEIPYSTVSRGTLYQSLFQAAGIDIYASELYETGRESSGMQDCFRVAKENGLCADTASVTEYVTRGEAAHAVFWVQTHGITQELPPIARTFPLCTLEGGKTSDIYVELEKVPQAILDSFLEDGWTFYVGTERLEKYNAKNGTSGIGLTNYTTKQVYVASNESVLHEMGHYLSSTLPNQDDIVMLYKQEGGQGRRLFREYASTDAHEYFADYFANWIDGRQAEHAAMKNLTPITYSYFEKLEAAGWIISA